MNNDGGKGEAVALWAAFAPEGNLLAHSKLRPGLSDILNWEPLYRTAPKAECAPREAQPVARDKKLDHDLHSQLMNVAFAAFDGGYKCRPAKETVRTIVKALAAFYEKRAGSTPERADAEKEK